ncbi:MAG: hypothetical protein KKH84_08760 [Proteobacteria bacterium]|nr:hypothetical protein [Pseudomonadota bacterium]MCG2756883.1 hypothetical protein [Desulfobacteraceae bacterium]
MSNHDIEKWFPKLQGGGYTITSPATVDYNCIAWAADDTESVWWPDRLYIGYWPAGIPRAETLEGFIEAFATLGFTQCDAAEYEKGFEKVAIYVDTSGKPTHAARQLSSGLWTSKLGNLQDIEHDIDGVSGDLYGSVAVIMKRSR